MNVNERSHRRQNHQNFLLLRLLLSENLARDGTHGSSGSPEGGDISDFILSLSLMALSFSRGTLQTADTATVPSAEANRKASRFSLSKQSNAITWRTSGSRKQRRALEMNKLG